MPALVTRAFDLALLWQTKFIIRLSKIPHASDGQSALIYWNKEPRYFVVALGHQGLLRTMKALGTRTGDCSSRVPLGTGYLNLPGVTIEDPGLVAWASELSKVLTPGHICPVSAAAVKKNSASAVHVLGRRTRTSSSTAYDKATQQITFAPS